VDKIDTFLVVVRSLTSFHPVLVTSWFGSGSHQNSSDATPCPTTIFPSFLSTRTPLPAYPMASSTSGVRSKRWPDMADAELSSEDPSSPRGPTPT
jgi:hypothetical protein